MTLLLVTAACGVRQLTLVHILNSSTQNTARMQTGRMLLPQMAQGRGLPPSHLPG